MERHDARHILRTLADGIDPLTTQPLDDESVLHRPDVIRALQKAAAALDEAPPRERPRVRRDLPPGVGTRWTAEEERRLVAAFDADQPLDEIAKQHARTRSGIRARLVRLGKLQPETPTATEAARE